MISEASCLMVGLSSSLLCPKQGEDINAASSPPRLHTGGLGEVDTAIMMAESRVVPDDHPKTGVVRSTPPQPVARFTCKKRINSTDQRQIQGGGGGGGGSNHLLGAICIGNKQNHPKKVGPDRTLTLISFPTSFLND